MAFNFGAAATGVGSLADAFETNRRQALEERRQQVIDAQTAAREKYQNAYQNLQMQKMQKELEHAYQVKLIDHPNGSQDAVVWTPSGGLQTYQTKAPDPQKQYDQYVSFLSPEERSKITPERKEDIIYGFMTGRNLPREGTAGKPPIHYAQEQDSSSKTGWSLIAYNPYTNEEYGRRSVSPTAYGTTARQTTSWRFDPDLNTWVESVSTMEPLIPRVAGGAPQAAPAAPGTSAAPPGAAPPAAAPGGVPSAAPSAAPKAAMPPAPGGVPGGGAAIRPGTVLATPTPESVKRYPLDQNGLIPTQPGLSETVRGVANQIIQKGDTNLVGRVPTKVMNQADAWVQGYTGYVPTVSPAGRRLLETSEPVMAQVNRLMKTIEDKKLQNDNTPLRLLKDRALYGIGVAPDPDSLGAKIAELSLGSVVEAASALQGSSRSWPALKVAFQHTPNAWVDSPMLMYQKLGAIRDRLQDMITEQRRGGLDVGGAAPQAGPGSAPAQTQPLKVIRDAKGTIVGVE